MRMRHKVLFLTLRVFSATGGIEKVCRIVGKALYETGLEEGSRTKIFCLHGERLPADSNHYFPQLMFTGFGGHRARFILNSIKASRRARVVMLSHINLLMVGVLIKLFNPSIKLVMLAHGIEVWDPLPGWKKWMLGRCDLILPVSQFTRDKMLELHHLPENKLQVLNNSLDPFLERPLLPKRKADLLERYGLQADEKILLTVARMADTEVYKGYDKVIQALPSLVVGYPSLRYLLVGSYGQKEKNRLDNLIRQLALEKQVIFAGFVPDEEMAAHFNLADIFIMPSEKEGFGIVFIEAMFYGKPVIAGNIDGSVDALCNGELGILVDPVNIEEIAAAIKKILANPGKFLPDAEKLQEHFGYTSYKRRLNEFLNA